MTEEINYEQGEFVTNFEKMFSEFSEGWTVSIYRESPKELSGFLEEIILEAGENPVDMQYLIRQWGGKILRLMLRDGKGIFRKRMIVPLKSYPPKLNGKIIGEDEQRSVNNNIDNTLAIIKSLRENTPKNQIDSIIPLLIPLIKVFIEKLSQQTPVIQSSGPSITEMMTALATMKEFITPPQDNGDFGTAMLGLADKVLPLLNNQKQKQIVPITPSTTTSSTSTTVPIPIQPQPTEPSDEQIMKYVTQKFLDNKIGGEQLTTMYFDMLAKMDENERSKAEEVLTSVLGIEQIDDDETTDIPASVHRNSKDPNT